MRQGEKLTTRRTALKLGLAATLVRARAPSKLLAEITIAPIRRAFDSNQRKIYIDATNGSDANDGSSPNQAKRTIAAGLGDGLRAGDNLLLASGGVWREGLTITTSGTKALPILIGAYGDGPAPIISAADGRAWKQGSPIKKTLRQTSQQVDPRIVLFGNRFGVCVSSEEKITEPDQWHWNKSSHVLTVYYSGRPEEIVEVGERDNAIRMLGCQHVMLQGISWRGAKDHGLFAAGEMEGIQIKNCLGELCFADGAFFSELNAPNKTGSLIHSEFRSNGATGFRLNGNFSEWQISDTRFYNNGLIAENASDAHIWTAGLKLWGNDVHGNGSIVERCAAYENGRNLQDAAKGLGIWIDQATGVTVRNCSSFHNDAWGIYFEKTTDCVMVHNQVWQCAQSAPYCAGIGVKSSGNANSTGNVIANNVVYASGCWGLYLGAYQGMGPARFDRNIVVNNIIDRSKKELLYVETGGANDGVFGVDNIYGHNCLGGELPSFISWNGRHLSSYSEWERSYGLPMANVEGDPQFANEERADFHLKSTSPCRGAAVVLPLLEKDIVAVHKNIGAL